MSKKIYRYFFWFIKRQEAWLNSMAHKGYRLIGTDKLSYTFDTCQPDEYQYRIEFIAQKSYAISNDYFNFIQELGYDVFYKNMNLNWSVGKITWRPYGEGAGQISTNPGTYNKELLIVGKKNDGKPFDLYSTIEDKAYYYSTIRNAWLTTSLLLIFFAIILYLKTLALTFGVAACTILGILLMVPSIIIQRKIKRLRSDSQLLDQ